MTPAISIHIDHGRAWLLPIEARALHVPLLKMAEIVNRSGLKLSSIELRLVNDATISLFNKKYLRCTGPTNIISFPADPAGEGLMALSLDTYARECFLYGQDESLHLLRLLAHGMAHLAGLDHGPEMDAISEECLCAGLKSLNGDF